MEVLRTLFLALVEDVRWLLPLEDSTRDVQHIGAEQKAPKIPTQSLDNGCE
jgi:hypothetical protein